MLYNLTMDKFFNPNNPITVLLARTFDLILLNICFVISCIPVFTAGAALTAMYSVTLKMAEGEWGYIIKNYTEAFRKNFRQATILWLILAGIGAFFAADIYILYYVLPEQYLFLQIVIWLLLFFDVSALIYVFPMLAKYEQTCKQLIKNSLLLGIGNIPLTIFTIVILGIIADLSLHNGSLMILFLSVFLFIGCALLALLFSVFFRRAFIKADGSEKD
ncbi:MAG: DUF624 domain-containing protein [Lachnospiraceae bacterium]|nr:DUF624 domain-containing protein [Lachnospiraceae bacterium]